MSPRYPWPQFRQPWLLVVDVEGELATTADVDPTTRRVRLDEAGDWSTVHFSFAASSTEKAPEGMTDVGAYVLVSSARTNTRVPVPLEQTGEQQFRGTCHVPRAMLAGSVAIAAQVLSTDPVHVVGESEMWTVVVDASAAPPRPGAPPFPTEWVDFAASDAPPSVRAARDTYAVMDMSGPKPVLRLNSGIKGFEALLGSTSAKLERRRLRDTLATRIALYAVSTLFREAVAQIDVDDAGVVTLPDDTLLRQVLETVAAESRLAASPDDFYAKIARPHLTSSLERTQLWAEIDTILDRLTDHGEQVARAVEEVRHV